MTDDASPSEIHPSVRANASEDPRFRLTDEEMISQMSVFILGGHETTASLMAWLLYELAKHPEFQGRLRDEIVQKRTELSARGDTDFSMDDFEHMTYLQATIKVRDIPAVFCPMLTFWFLHRKLCDIIQSSIMLRVRLPKTTLSHCPTQS